ncbi:hypothetical protein J5N97_017810 [Dioscorea zingiberensis]|uniref:Uncharacterized protein n=1 Tax=Dioscorea zingiberensis TaxID=325984 RepID=A0A9D5CMA3_9LILI|nr:hypothetical protein J5N97_017810 [Dioscorea zingiberensis]
MDALQVHFNIHPFLTHLVWEDLEKANKTFFKDYNYRLELIEHIQTFSQLLRKVYEMSGQIAPSNVVNQVPTSSTPANALCERNTLSAVINQGMYQGMDDRDLFGVVPPYPKYPNAVFTRSNVGQIAPSNVANQVPSSSTPANALCERNTSSGVIDQGMYQGMGDMDIFHAVTPYLEYRNEVFPQSNVGQIAPSNVDKQVPTSSTPAINSFGVVAPYVEYSNHVYTQSNDAPENQWSHPSLSFQAISGSNYAAQAPTWEYMAPYLS